MEKSDRPVDYSRLTINICARENFEDTKSDDGLTSKEICTKYDLPI